MLEIGPIPFLGLDLIDPRSSYEYYYRRDSISHSALETQSNAYATINKLPMAGSSRRSLFNGSLDITDHNESRDYATLEKSYR